MLRRREALALPAALLSQGLVNAAALTQPMPYVLVVPTPAGGPVDRVARALAPGFVARGSGKIVNVGSVQSVLARQTIAPYSASKAASLS